MKTALAILLPFFISLLFLPLFGFSTPKNEVFLQAISVGDSVVFNETWFYREGGVRTLPPEAQLISVKCPGQASVDYGRNLNVVCRREFPFTFSISYSLPSNVTRIYSGDFVKVNYGTFQKFWAFPKKVGRVILFSFKPTNFNELSKLESNWFVNLYLVLSLEVFFAFILYLYSRQNSRVQAKGMSSRPPKHRPPHELGKIFGARDNAVLNAEAFWLASKGVLDLSKDKVTILNQGVKGFEKKVLDLLVAFSENNEILLDKDWLSVKKAEVGKLKKPKFSNPLKFDSLPKFTLMLVQGGISLLALLSYIFTPSFLVNYRTSLLALTFINLVWMFFTYFSDLGVLSREGKEELSAWLKYKRFLESPSELERYKGDWLYPLVVSLLLDLDLAGKILSMKGVRLRNIQDPRITLFDYFE